MSESKTACPFCNRQPGEIHDDFCSRSAVRMAGLHAEAKRKTRPRLFWRKGSVAVRFPGEKTKLIVNPGVPYVKSDKRWTAGGLPPNSPELDEFKRELRIK